MVMMIRMMKMSVAVKEGVAGCDEVVANWLPCAKTKL